MSFNRIWTANCDECCEGLDVSYYEVDLKSELITLMRRDGWTVGKRVLCPQCKNPNPAKEER